MSQSPAPERLHAQSSATHRLGRPLKFDPEKERFTGAPEADKLLAREYRKPLVVPEEVCATTGAPPSATHGTPAGRAGDA